MQIRSFDEYFKENARIAQYGIPYLDDKLKGINANALVLIGARSGAGKSTLADIIAQTNRYNKNKVHLFVLENFDGDLPLVRGYYLYKSLSGNKDLDINDWVCGNFERDEKAFRDMELSINESFRDLRVTTRNVSNYTIDDLKNDLIKSYSDEKEPCRLFIIDHIDYLYKENEGISDNQHISDIMSMLREFQYANKGCAIVAFSHLRKPTNSKDIPAVPSMDEFQGSSNKVKQSTVVITVAPDDNTNEENSLNNANTDLRSTWFCVRKSRFGGIDNKVARMDFDIKTGKYLKYYQLCTVNYRGEILDKKEK